MAPQQNDLQPLVQSTPMARPVHCHIATEVSSALSIDTPASTQSPAQVGIYADDFAFFSINPVQELLFWTEIAKH